ncbi:hypothetical protein DOY81_003002 [Sarcophaga bullata]|nr:hypothetical protein DOY81_003002 [Sarcophaga bullata]
MLAAAAKATVTAQTANADDNKASLNMQENNGVVLNSDADNSFCRLSLIKAEQFEESQQQQQYCDVPLENSLRSRQPTNDEDDAKTLPTNFSELNDDDFVDRTQHSKHAAVAEDMDLSASAQISPGLSLLQQTAAAASSPPPHSYRHSRAYRHFKNPPQPHMCIRTTTESGEELFINVLSWTRIVIPQEPSDPIPLYGGMRVPPGSPRSPPIVFAVMANPEVLKDSGRHSKDPEERRAMVELMCDFVEAMNPGVKLVRNAIILKDRDISGELKDVWNAVQAQRDREREEQIILQRQQHQQHFHHNLNSSPTANNGTLNGNSFATATNSLSTTPPTTHQMFPKSLHNAGANGNETTALPTVVDGGTPPRSRKLVVQQVQNDYNNTTSNIDEELEKSKEGNVYNMSKGLNNQVSLSLLAERLDNKLVLTSSGEEQHKNELQMKQHQQQHNQNILLNDDALSNGSLLEISGSGSGKNDINNQLNALNCKKEQRSLKNGFATSCNEAEVVINVNDATTPVSDTPNTPAQIVNPVPATPPVQQTPTKKEKLGGFLPNGCIFPRFTKNNKYKDKDKDKEKDSKPKDKEKNALLSALKKAKDKKSSASAAAVNNDENNTSSNTNTNTAVVNNCFNQTQQTSFNKQQKNCLPQLECGVQKLDLKNHHHHHHHHHPPHNSENTTTNTTTATNTTTKNNAANKTNSSSKNSGVGVH